MLKNFVTLFLVIGCSLFLTSCETEEQGRILMYEKGKYLGKPDQKLSRQQLTELTARTSGQGGN